MSGGRLEFRVFGSPAPQGSKKHVGNGRMIESSKKVRPWREDVKAVAETIRDGMPPIESPLRVTFVFTLPKPQSAPKKRKTWPSKKPDLSKLIRSTEDAMVDAGLIRDDALIVECIAKKVFPGEDTYALPAPGVYVCVEEVWA